MLTDSQPLPFDPVALRRKRLDRTRAMMRDKGYSALLLFDPNNQRYATGSRNMFGYFLRNSTRYIYVPAQGPVILFEYPQSFHVSDVLETIDESRTSKVVWSSVMGKDGDTAKPFADEIAALVKRDSGSEKKVGLDRCYLNLATALSNSGLVAVDCMQDLLATRAVKLEEEVTCLRLSMASAEAAVFEMAQAIRPGVREEELFGKMVGNLISRGGEFVETRLLSSGHRTNPWFNEAGPKQVRPGELVAVDTDAIGNFGYYSDFSRTFRCGPGKPTGEQKTLYRMAFEQVQHNIEIIRPGRSLREISESAWKIPDRYVDRRYTSVIHGCGMHGESPFITHSMDWSQFGVDGVIEPNMVLCVESYIGEVGGAEGVKLEEEVLVTQSGVEKISKYPFDDTLLTREV